MTHLIFLDRLEEEYLLRTGEAAIHVRQLRQFTLWTQGQVQGLLPHQLMVCLQFGVNDALLAIECIDGLAREPGFVRRLCEGEQSVALRLARHWRAAGKTPSILSGASEHGPVDSLRRDIDALGLRNAIGHGAGPLSGGASFFILFGVAADPGPRQAFFLELLLPHLHLAFQRVQAANEAVTPVTPLDQLTSREQEILTWVMRGKSNIEIGELLTVSALTVKNHLQKIYRKLKVHTRVQAVARCWELQPAPARYANGK